jgi:immunity protein 52 of polymorphic toxin system
MEEDSFFLGSYWNRKKQTLDEIANKTSQMLRRLAEIDIQFLHWYEGSKSRSESLNLPVTLSPDKIKYLFSEEKYHGNNNPGAFQFGVWSGHDDSESSSVTIRAGATDMFPNFIIISLPFEGDAKGRLLQIDKIKSIISVLVELWEPDTIVLVSEKLKNLLSTINEVGWITYIKTLHNDPRLNAEVRHEQAFGGHLFYLSTPKLVDYKLATKLLPLKDFIEV